METLSKLYLELAHVVPRDTKSSRELSYELQIKQALKHLDHATPQQRNGPVYQAADRLRSALGIGPMEIGGKPSDDVPR